MSAGSTVSATTRWVSPESPSSPLTAPVRRLKWKGRDVEEGRGEGGKGKRGRDKGEERRKGGKHVHACITVHVYTVERNCDSKRYRS